MAAAAAGDAGDAGGQRELRPFKRHNTYYVWNGMGWDVMGWR